MSRGTHKDNKRNERPARLTPYQRIMRAAERGTGVRLSVEDVLAMASDTAIVECAMNDDESAEVSLT